MKETLGLLFATLLIVLGTDSFSRGTSIGLARSLEIFLVVMLVYVAGEKHPEI